MVKKNGETISFIRQNKGYSQKYVASNVLTQGAFSKFEKYNTDIRLSAFEQIITKLELSFEEFKYVQNGYEFNARERLLNTLFNLTYNNKVELESLKEEATLYLQQQEDFLIEDLIRICDSLMILGETNNIEEARIPLEKVWERLSKRNHFYIVDIYFINSILFLFPLETALEIRKFIFRSIDRYKNFQDIERLKINISLNIMLLLMKVQKFEEALSETEHAMLLCKKHADYLRLAIFYIRKGICMGRLQISGDDWIMKGEGILIAIEELNVLEIMKDEKNRMEV